LRRISNVNALREYDINIVGLENKRYEYDFSSGRFATVA